MVKKFLLELEGRVTTQSGKLLVIDACNVEDARLDEAREYVHHLLDSERGSRFFGTQTAERRYIERMRTVVGDLIMSTKSSIEQRTRKTLKLARKTRYLKNEYHAVQRGNTQRGRTSQRPMSVPPYFLQEDKFVYFGNNIGDGEYPIIESDDGFTLIFDFPMNTNDGGIIEVDTTRLEGKLLGKCCVDSASQVIMEPIGPKIHSDVRLDAYCIVDLSPGTYSCKYGKNMDSLIVKRVY